VDLRDGPTFGKTFSIEITPDIAIFVPRGVANGYQTLTPNITYAYLTSAHWSPETKYTFVNLFDPKLAIKWPIEKSSCILSDKDMNHPLLSDVIPMEV
jgi:dTDP-4-dehydrorhamnose 3,5-epimerase